MEIVKPDVQAAQTAPAAEGEVTLKEGEEVNAKFIRNLSTGMVQLNIKGKVVTAETDVNMSSSKTFIAVVVKNPDGSTALRLYPPLPEFAETKSNTSGLQYTSPQSQTSQTQANTQGQTAQGQTTQPQVSSQTGQTVTSQSSAMNIQQNQTGAQQGQNQTLAQTTAGTDSQSAAMTQKQTSVNMPMDIHPGARQPIGTATLKSSDVRLIPMDQQTGQTGSSQKTAQNPQQNAYSTASAVKPAETVMLDGRAQAIRLPAGSIPVQEGETVEVNILKMQENGKTLVSIKDSLFELKLGPQVFKSLLAEVTSKSSLIDLSILRTPVETLDQSYVKQQVSGFDIEKIMKAFGKFQHVSMEDMTAEKLKQSLKDSGLTFENKLLNGHDVAGDEKFNALLNQDTSAKDSLTRMQVTNLFLAGGILAFLKTKDENVDDTLLRYKPGADGNGTVFVSTSFSELGDTLISIRQNKNKFSVSVKTEKDISKELSDLRLENSSIHWYKFNKQDLEMLDPKKDISADLGSFEVII
ncbi:MAG: hypothetical protein AB7E96_05280 [Deferribacterales bacterium]